MSRLGILAALKTGPKTTAELLRVTGTWSGGVSRDCAALVKDGRVKRIDGTSGRGSRAIYALVAETCAAPELKPQTRLFRGRSCVSQPEIPDTYVNRDPCPKCGVRGDIGCRHVRRAA
ncbi:MAG TPA: hypothetical protein PK823_16545 [Novosphingobium sp.]|nr:hypothetical protein [Novosphingobium sp.]